MSIKNKFGVSEKDWSNWQWQQKNSIYSSQQIQDMYPNFPILEIEQIESFEKENRWSITPYTLNLMKLDQKGNPSKEDPLVKQFFPIRGFKLDNAIDSYSKDNNNNNNNWELPDEMPTRILQHKYKNKAIFRLPDACLGYCGFCFEVKRTKDKQTNKRNITKNAWIQSLEYLQNHPEIKEIIFSGGDPLLNSNKSLENKLQGVLEIKHVRAIRINTRALTFNPYRFDDEFIDLMKKYNITSINFDICHPNELSKDAKEVIERFDKRGYGSILKMGNIPLIKGVNNEKKVLENLFMKMYSEFKIKPYYLYHAMPWSPSAKQYRTTVKEGVKLVNQLKRNLPNIALPEYVIVHHNGKHTVPLEENGTPDFQYTKNNEGNSIIKFRNYKGDNEIYLDAQT